MDPEDTPGTSMPDLSDWQGSETCAQCGAPVALEFERGFAVDTDRLLCWGCSIERGGEYDAELDRWVVAPNILDLAE